MKAFKDYNETKAYSDFQKIPAGGYIAVIKAAEIKTFSGSKGPFEKLIISFDIAEGDFKDYYANQYRSNTANDKKWKGTLGIFVPADDGSEQDAKTKRRFKTAIESIEESNANYHWDWDEDKLKGKKCGVVLQNREWSMNGKTGWTASPFYITSTEAIRANTFRMPEDKPLNGASVSSSRPAPGATIEVLDEDDLPF